MNNWHTEYMAEYHRQQILEDVAQIHLENSTSRVRLYRPSLFTRTMYNFANWMIHTGKELRKRYEIPAVNCNKTGSFAH